MLIINTKGRRRERGANTRKLNAINSRAEKYVFCHKKILISEATKRQTRNEREK